MSDRKGLVRLLKDGREQMHRQWIESLQRSAVYRQELVGDEELREQCGNLLDLIINAVEAGGVDESDGPMWDPVREELASIARDRAEDGLQPSEVAAFVLLLKQPVFHQLSSQQGVDASDIVPELLAIDRVLDNCVLWMTETFQDRLREVIKRQQSDLLELSTPVIELWEKVLALPLIGTLDSVRTQVVMESLLEKIVETRAEVAILDITGVPTVDTMVAQHLLKAVTAGRLMGATCIISGVRPTIAQTMVQLGVDLQDVTTKATLADAFEWALARQRLAVTAADGRVGADEDQPS